MNRFSVRQSSVNSADYEVFDHQDMKHVEPRFPAEKLAAALSLANTLNTNQELDRMADEERTMMELHLLRKGWTRQAEGRWQFLDEFGTFSGNLDWSYERQLAWDRQEIESIQ